MRETMQPTGTTISIDGASIPAELQVDIAHMTLDEAIVSGMFDVPDEPGMVHIPVTLDVTVPNELLWPSRSPSGHVIFSSPDGVPPQSGQSPSRRRFVNYPKGLAAEKIAESFRDIFEMRRGAPGNALGIPPVGPEIHINIDPSRCRRGR